MHSPVFEPTATGFLSTNRSSSHTCCINLGNKWLTLLIFDVIDCNCKGLSRDLSNGLLPTIAGHASLSLDGRYPFLKAKHVPLMH